MKSYLIKTFVFSLTANAAFSASFTLNFGSVSDSTFGDTNPDFIEYGVVANDGTTDVYARLQSFQTFARKNPANSGSTSGDGRVNVGANGVGGSADFRLELFSDSSYSTAYAPSSSYSWAMMFYDIDGESDGGAWDEITVGTPGTYTITETSKLAITANGNSTKFSGKNVDGTFVNTQGGATVFNNQAEADAAFFFEVTNTSSIDFNYSAVNNGRNALFDGGQLTFSGFGNTIQGQTGQAIPEPSTWAFGLAGLGSLLRRRRSRATSSAD